MARLQPGELPPWLRESTAKRSLASVEKRVRLWLQQDPPPEHRQRIADLVFADLTEPQTGPQLVEQLELVAQQPGTRR